MPVRTPTIVAALAGRKYITPEDITTSAQGGCGVLEVWRDVLEHVETGSLEDASCCAFVALKMLKLVPA